MSERKTFIGPRLRQLRRDRKQTQAAMAQALGISPAYVNLLENNQRSLSVQMLLRISDVYRVDWRDLLEDDAQAALADLRAALQDPVFGPDRPDLQEMRGALDHSPRLVRALLTLHQRYQTLSERVLGGERAGAELPVSAESVVHDLFRRRRNHFDPLERAAEAVRADANPGDAPEPEELYGWFKARLAEKLRVSVVSVYGARATDALRSYDEQERVIRLSDALDYQNKVFQLAHMIGLLEFREQIDALVAEAEPTAADQVAAEAWARAAARCRVELANYFAAALLTPYEPFLAAARRTRYDIDALAAQFGVSFEQACHRLTTLQRAGDEGVPFFFLRIDKAGNVAKRFNATSFQLAEYGGACPRWDIHLSFRMPGRILPQFVELPDGARFFTVSRTVDRPALGRQSHDHRLAVCLGCAIEHVHEISYADPFTLEAPDLFQPIGINCRLCPRQNCAQRAHLPVHLELPVDERRRGATRFES